MRFLLLAVSLALLACSPTPTAPPPEIPTAVAFTVDLSQAPAPTNVTATFDSVGRNCPSCAQRAYFTVTWTDNSTFSDEFNTCGTFTDTGGAPVGSGCAYAVAYDQPSGSTGIRSSNVFVAKRGGPYTLTLNTNRYVDLGGGSMTSVIGPESVPISACGAKHC